jgi:arsenate reductase
MFKVYTYAQCDTCRRATRWLRDEGIAFEEIPIRETPPSIAELRTMLAARGGDVRKLCNTSGRDYRALQLGEKLPTMSETAVLTLLAGNGNLIKRPFLIGPGAALVGFDATLWQASRLKK